MSNELNIHTLQRQLATATNRAADAEAARDAADGENILFIQAINAHLDGDRDALRLSLTPLPGRAALAATVIERARGLSAFFRAELAADDEPYTPLTPFGEMAHSVVAAVRAMDGQA